MKINKQIYKDKQEFTVAHPMESLILAVSRSNWNLEVLVSVEGGKPENSEKNQALNKDGNHHQETLA